MNQDVDGMMNYGGNTQTFASIDPNSAEKRYAVDSSQLHTSPYISTSTGSAGVSWMVQRVDIRPAENGNLSNSSYHPEHPTEPVVRGIQEGAYTPSLAATSSSGTTNSAPGYSGYASYQTSTDPYPYGRTGYQGYYDGYQQQSTHSYSQPGGSYQNTGAPYQPLSSFPNSGSYSGPASYSSTYYNPADYQTTGGGYSTSGYNNQTTTWSDGNYANYTTQPYSNYTSDTTGTYSSSITTPTSLPYQQHYKQWTDYYSQTEVSCAPGTENLSVSSTSTQVCPVTGGNSTSNGQHTQSFVQPWRPDSSISQSQSQVQPGATVSSGHDGYWRHGAQSFQNHHASPTQPHYPNPLDQKPSYDNFQDQHTAALAQGVNSQHSSAHILPQVYQPPAPLSDTRRVNKMQIPTNPRIASNFPLGLQKTDKDNLSTSIIEKPAYISVSLPRPNDNTADSILKPGMFPKALRGYVERALARCKDDKQKTACQGALKEIITKATADGTLYTRDWDTEPLLTVLNMDISNNEPLCSTPVSPSPKHKRSPNRRSKSRWEPLPDQTLVGKPVSASNNSMKFSGWFHNEKDKKPISNSESKLDDPSNFNFSLPEQKSAYKKFQRASKRQRAANDAHAANNGDASSDSDKEQSLTAYYSGALALASSSEEKKRRESRSKRFEKRQGHRADNNIYKPKNGNTGNLYTRRATAMVLSKNFEAGSNPAVEDINWDSLTVKGTCQEIEKRYLRLTSAPDPSTVRPEEVLEKALLMVQNTQKNYLYKCDQLKSIRQDLTVQRIHNQLTVKVYETHARLALEGGDLPEYNQCQSQLKILYAEGIEGCHVEFSSYNLLYVSLHSNNNRELLSSMSRLTKEAKKEKAVKHALAVRSAITSGNYVTFFTLYKIAPNLSMCLMDLYVEKMRYKALNCMSRSYRPTVPVSYIAQVLGFTGVTSLNGEADGLEECVEWLKTHGACLIASDNIGEMQLDAKASSTSLYMPEPEDAVAHGDANLAVNDFFTRTSS